MMERNGSDEDGFTLRDLGHRLKDAWRWSVGGLLIGGAVGAGVLLVLPERYEAVGLLQVGHVGQVGQAGQPGQPGQPGQGVLVTSTPVDPVSVALERVNSPAFRLRVAESVGDQSWAEGIRTSSASAKEAVRGQVLKSAPLIDLRVRGESPEQAGKRALAIVRELAKVQLELAKPAIEKLKSDLAVGRDKLAAAERDREAVNQLMQSASVRDDRFTQIALMTSLRVQKEAEVYAQRQALSSIETALMEPMTRPAHHIEPFLVGDRPVYPNRWLVIALGLIGGLALGVAGALVSTAVKGKA